MNLCPDCTRAERDPLHILGERFPCCYARRVANTPRPGMAAAYAGAIAGMDEATAAWVRDRAYQLIRAAKGRA